MTEQELIALYRRYDGPLKSFANKWTKDFETSDNIVIEAWIQVIKGNIVDGGKFWQVMCNYVKWRAMDRIKHLSRVARLDAEQPDPVTSVPPVYPERVLRCLNTLPKARRVIARMIFIEEYTPKECAEALGLSVDTVRVQASRARRFLKVILN